MAAGFIHTIKSIRIKNILDSDLKKTKQNKTKQKAKQMKTKTKNKTKTTNFLCILYHCLDINSEKIFPTLEI